MQQQNQKTSVRNPLEELVEIGKTAVEQTGVKPTSVEQSQPVSQPEMTAPKPSILEKKKTTQIRAMENELEEIRVRRAQAEQQREMVEEQTVQQGEYVKEEKKQSFFEKGLALVKKQGPGIETRKQKAA